MIWGRIKTAKGDILSGEIRDGFIRVGGALGDVAPDAVAIPLEGATWLAPCAPGKFIGLWNNYHAAAEKNGHTIPDHPLWFLKPLSSVSGHGADVVLPTAAGRVIFEGELGIVIGQRCHMASEDEAGAAIFGYTCINDLTSLDVLNANPAFAQWARAKGFDGFGVIGPVIATGLDWRVLSIRTLVNGRERQAYPASDMIFSPAEIVRRLSFDMTLEPGDVIAVGTSLGVRPVKAGDQISVLIEGIGAVDVTLSGPAT
ncbi:fumarylacetoacetate hydrolase family protein [Pseudogemmobacter sp. W21_MBD1_M6]|uniref:fumarylacetoacetate hydrolase family protein n=1 Tax=Pseudogemmobacter sp. W21_MBD1_M6 TaxID=3240271 RepID=UPI003F96897E